MPASSRSSSLSSSLGTSLSSSRAPSAGALWSRPPPEEVHYVAVSAGGPRCNKLRKFTPKAPKERKLPPMSAADLAQEISVGLRHASRRTQHEGAYSSASGGDAEAARLGETLAARAAAGRPPLAFDLSTNSLSAARLHELAGLCALGWLPSGFFGPDDLFVIGCVTVLTGLGVRERVLA